ncbi:MAG: hypothetical protein ACLTSX_01975 [Collinsella sp.]
MRARDAASAATAGIGPNLFLGEGRARHLRPSMSDDGIGELDEQALSGETVWRHRPITRHLGHRSGHRRAPGDVPRPRPACGVAALDERILYREFGVNAEYLIDHAHGIEALHHRRDPGVPPASRPSTVNGQVLSRNYSYDEALTVLREMVDASVLELVETQACVASSISLYRGLWRTRSARLRRLDASAAARQYVDACGHRRSTTAEDMLLASQAAGQARTRRRTCHARTAIAERRPAAAAEGAPAAHAGQSYAVNTGRAPPGGTSAHTRTRSTAAQARRSERTRAADAS